MKTNIIKKQNIVTSIKQMADNSILTVMIQFAYVKSLKLKELRHVLTKSNIKLILIKNTLVKKAIMNTRNEPLLKQLSGQQLILFSNEIKEPIKILKKFNKNDINIKINSICLYGKLYLNNKINYILNMPSEKNALIKIIVILRTPLVRLIKLLKVSGVKLIILLNKIIKNLEGDKLCL